MRVMTRAGQYINLSDGLIVHQEKVVTNTDTYYVIHLNDGRKLAVTTPAPKVKLITVDIRESRRDE
jgi:hypothetical protein